MTVKGSEKKPDEPSELEKISSSYRSGWIYAEYAFQYGLSIIICSLLGYWLDNVFNTGNVLLITGVIFGAVAGFINLLRGLNARGRFDLKKSDKLKE